MGRIIKTLLIVSIVIFHFSFFIFHFSKKAFADTSCQPIYGGGQTCVTTGNILIDKKVLNPSTNTLVDNLGINDPKYNPGFIVNFRLEVTNTGNVTINRVDVKDIFPQYIEFNSGPGNFDQNTRTLTLSLDNLTPNETRTFIVMGRVVAANQLPTSGIVCVVNQAMAVTSDNGNSQDNTQLCIENKIPAPVVITKGGFPVLSPVPVTITPSTGPEALALFSLIPTGLTGWFMIRYASRKKGEK